ncbi:MAG: hypothetical protein ABWX92_12000 [Mycetocola sp.]
MTLITGNARRDAEQRLDSVDYNLSQLRALISASGADLHPDRDGGEADATGEGNHDRPFESIVAETFGRWVLDLLGMGESAPSDVVRLARTQLVGALSKRAGDNSTADDQQADALLFVDVFAGDDLVSAPDEELGVKPISYAP